MDRLVWGMSITLEEDGGTLLTGPVLDQAALYGLPRRVRDSEIPLPFVNRAEPAQADASDLKQRIEARWGYFERRFADIAFLA